MYTDTAQTEEHTHTYLRVCMIKPYERRYVCMYVHTYLESLILNPNHIELPGLLYKTSIHSLQGQL